MSHGGSECVRRWSLCAHRDLCGLQWRAKRENENVPSLSLSGFYHHIVMCISASILCLTLVFSCVIRHINRQSSLMGIVISVMYSDDEVIIFILVFSLSLSLKILWEIHDQSLPVLIIALLAPVIVVCMLIICNSIFETNPMFWNPYTVAPPVSFVTLSPIRPNWNSGPWN